ncbi:MAG: DUF349 domain-containing protein, partial [Bacteroidetes bacterium]|nr:DUF349 domain-containing protein [Candidatus Egerieousia excrementavium]
MENIEQQDPVEEKTESQEVVVDSVIDLPDYSNKTLKEIIEIFRQMLDKGDQQEMYKNADALKAAFYKILKKEKIAAGVFNLPVAALQNTEDSAEGENAEVSGAAGEQAEESAANPYVELERGFKELYAAYKQSRASYLQNLEKVKEENLQKKLQIIEELKELVEKAEDVNSTFPAFRELQNRWKEISLVPQSKARDLWESYQHCVERFYDYIKINNEFRDLDFKKNLELKTELCEKAEALGQEPNVVNAFKELQKLHEEWKELGPVAKEYRESIWERFKNATSVVNKRHQSFFENLKQDQKQNLIKKTALCEQAESIAASHCEDSNGWNKLSKQMEDLQTEWKKIGFAAKKDNQKIYDRFRAACDKFYNAKREYYLNFKSSMRENLAHKEELCEKAEALSSSEDWKGTTEKLIELQKEWKEIGPVARKQAELVWKRFRSACDIFFENKARYFGEQDAKYEENLAAKSALIEELRAYKVSDSKDDNIAAMKSFLARWNDIGFVPFKEKERIQKEWNEAMESHFADIRSLESEKKFSKFRRMVTEFRTSGKDRAL